MTLFEVLQRKKKKKVGRGEKIARTMTTEDTSLYVAMGAGSSCYMGFRRIHEMKHSYDMSRPPSTTHFGCHEIKLHC